MSSVKELYVSLRDDPDLPIPEGESRESAAWNETSQRTRQHKTNAKALSMATESAVEKLFKFTLPAPVAEQNLQKFLNFTLENPLSRPPSIFKDWMEKQKDFEEWITKEAGKDAGHLTNDAIHKALAETDIHHTVDGKPSGTAGIRDHRGLQDRIDAFHTNLTSNFEREKRLANQEFDKVNKQERNWLRGKNISQADIDLFEQIRQAEVAEAIKTRALKDVETEFNQKSDSKKNRLAKREAETKVHNNFRNTTALDESGKPLEPTKLRAGLNKKDVDLYETFQTNIDKAKVVKDRAIYKAQNGLDRSLQQVGLKGTDVVKTEMQLREGVEDKKVKVDPSSISGFLKMPHGQQWLSTAWPNSKSGKAWNKITDLRRREDISRADQKDLNQTMLDNPYLFDDEGEFITAEKAFAKFANPANRDKPWKGGIRETGAGDTGTHEGFQDIPTAEDPISLDEAFNAHQDNIGPEGSDTRDAAYRNVNPKETPLPEWPEDKPEPSPEEKAFIASYLDKGVPRDWRRWELARTTKDRKYDHTKDSKSYDLSQKYNNTLKVSQNKKNSLYTALGEAQTDGRPLSTKSRDQIIEDFSNKQGKKGEYIGVPLFHIPAKRNEPDDIEHNAIKDQRKTITDYFSAKDRFKEGVDELAREMLQVGAAPALRSKTSTSVSPSGEEIQIAPKGYADLSNTQRQSIVNWMMKDEQDGELVYKEDPDNTGERKSDENPTGLSDSPRASTQRAIQNLRSIRDALPTHNQSHEEIVHRVLETAGTAERPPRIIDRTEQAIPEDIRREIDEHNRQLELDIAAAARSRDDPKKRTLPTPTRAPRTYPTPKVELHRGDAKSPGDKLPKAYGSNEALVNELNKVAEKHLGKGHTFYDLSGEGNDFFDDEGNFSGWKVDDEGNFNRELDESGDPLETDHFNNDVLDGIKSAWGQFGYPSEEKIELFGKTHQTRLEDKGKYTIEGTDWEKIFNPPSLYSDDNVKIGDDESIRRGDSWHRVSPEAQLNLNNLLTAYANKTKDKFITDHNNNPDIQKENQWIDDNKKNFPELTEKTEKHLKDIARREQNTAAQTEHSKALEEKLPNLTELAQNLSEKERTLEAIIAPAKGGATFSKERRDAMLKQRNIAQAKFMAAHREFHDEFISPIQKMGKDADGKKIKIESDEDYQARLEAHQEAMPDFIRQFASDEVDTMQQDIGNATALGKRDRDNADYALGNISQLYKQFKENEKKDIPDPTLINMGLSFNYRFRNHLNRVSEGSVRELTSEQMEGESDTAFNYRKNREKKFEYRYNVNDEPKSIYGDTREEAERLGKESLINPAFKKWSNDRAALKTEEEKAEYDKKFEKPQELLDGTFKESITTFDTFGAEEQKMYGILMDFIPNPQLTDAEIDIATSTKMEGGKIKSTQKGVTLEERKRNEDVARQLRKPLTRDEKSALGGLLRSFDKQWNSPEAINARDRYRASEGAERAGGPEGQEEQSYHPNPHRNLYDDPHESEYGSYEDVKDLMGKTDKLTEKEFNSPEFQALLPAIQRLKDDNIVANGRAAASIMRAIGGVDEEGNFKVPTEQNIEDMENLIRDHHMHPTRDKVGAGKRGKNRGVPLAGGRWANGEPPANVKKILKTMKDETGKHAFDDEGNFIGETAEQREKRYAKRENNATKAKEIWGAHPKNPKHVKAANEENQFERTDPITVKPVVEEPVVEEPVEEEVDGQARMDLGNVETVETVETDDDAEQVDDDDKGEPPKGEQGKLFDDEGQPIVQPVEEEEESVVGKPKGKKRRRYRLERDKDPFVGQNGEVTYTEETPPDKAIDNYIEQAKEAGLLQHMYEQKYGKEDDPDRSPFADTLTVFEAKLRKKYIKNPDKLKEDFFIEHGKMKKFQDTEKAKKEEVEAQQAANDQKEQDKRYADAKTPLMDKAAEAGVELKGKNAEQLIRNFDGDVDKAFNAHKNANTFPEDIDSIDKIQEKLFGAGVGSPHAYSKEREANRHGAVSTGIVRDLTAHWKANKENMNAETEEKFGELLRFANDPTKHKNIKDVQFKRGENIKADYEAAINDVNTAKEKGFEYNSDEAQRIYRNADEKRDRKARNFHAAHIDHTSTKQEDSHDVFADKVIRDSDSGDWSMQRHHSNKYGHFDEDGNMIGRKSYDHKEKKHVEEKFSDDGRDDHMKRGDTEARKSRWVEHPHSDIPKEELEKLKQSHRDLEASTEAGEEPQAQAGHRLNIERTEKKFGLDKSDYMHPEGEEPKHGPPDPSKAKAMTAEGYEWHEATRSWGLVANHDKWIKENGSTGSTFGTGASMGMVDEDGVSFGENNELVTKPSDGHFLFSPHGTHKVNFNTNNPGNTHQQVQATKLGANQHLQGLSQNLGTEPVNVHLGHLMDTGLHHSDAGPDGHESGNWPHGLQARAQTQVGLARAGKAAKQIGQRLLPFGAGAQGDPLYQAGQKATQAFGGAAESFGGAAKGLFQGFKDIGKAELTAVEQLSRHVAIQKAQGKSKIKV